MQLLRRFFGAMTSEKSLKIICILLLAFIAAKLSSIEESTRRSLWDLDGIREDAYTIKKKVDSIESDVNFIKHSQR